MATKQAEATDPLNDLWSEIEHAAQFDDGAAARRHLEAGRAIYHCDADTPLGTVIKEYPDGRREFARFDADGEHIVTVAA